MRIKVKTAIYRNAQKLQIFYTHFVTTSHTLVPNAHRLFFFQVSLKEVRIIPISRKRGTLLKFGKYSTHVVSFLIDLMIVRVHW